MHRAGLRAARDVPRVRGGGGGGEQETRSWRDNVAINHRRWDRKIGVRVKEAEGVLQAHGGPGDALDLHMAGMDVRRQHMINVQCDRARRNFALAPGQADHVNRLHLNIRRQPFVPKDPLDEFASFVRRNEDLVPVDVRAARGHAFRKDVWRDRWHGKDEMKPHHDYGMATKMGLPRMGVHGGEREVAGLPRGVHLRAMY